MSSFKRDICSSKNKNMQRSFPKWTSPEVEEQPSRCPLFKMDISIYQYQLDSNNPNDRNPTFAPESDYWRANCDSTDSSSE